ncbi:MAG: preprotein translocase subunit SecE [Gammaproteobacteria bacterium]|nr:MAG: preprotein translocase subunit SecE [Gammaproteobacteria bacterium]
MNLDKLKLWLAVLILGVGIAAYYYLAEQSDLVRIGVVVGAFVVAMIVALQSDQGKAAWIFFKAADTERRKVVWPTRKETIQVTLVVFAVVVLVAVFLWIVDWGLHKAVQALTT